jgi:hypothetical protein
LKERRALAFRQGQKRPIEFSHALDELISSEVREGEDVRGASDARGFLGMIEDVKDLLGQGLRIFRGDEPSGLSMPNEIGGASNRRRDDGSSRRHGFDHGDGRSLIEGAVHD